MAYTPNVWDVGDVITPQKMNHIENGISDAEQSGGGYDIVVGTPNFYSTNVSDYTKLVWDYNTILSKVRNGELVTGILVEHFNYDENVDGETTQNCAPMTSISIVTGEGWICFSYVVPSGNYTSSVFSLAANRTIISFNPSTGEFTNVANSHSIKTVS